MSLLPNFPGIQDLNLSENSNVSDSLNSSSHSLSRSDLPLPSDIFCRRMQEQQLQFEKEREETKMKLLHQIHENQITNYFHLNSRIGDVQLGQNRTERQLSELRYDVTEIKMGMQALLNQNTSQSPALSPAPRSDIGSPPHKPGGTTTVHCEVTTECCNTKVIIPLDYIPGRARYEDKYLCSICKKSLGKNYYQKHVQAVCLRKRGCPNCQP